MRWSSYRRKVPRKRIAVTSWKGKAVASAVASVRKGAMRAGGVLAIARGLFRLAGGTRKDASGLLVRGRKGGLGVWGGGAA